MGCTSNAPAFLLPFLLGMFTKKCLKGSVQNRYLGCKIVKSCALAALGLQCRYKPRAHDLTIT